MANRKGSVLMVRKDGRRFFVCAGCEVLAEIPEMGAQGNILIREMRTRRAKVVYIHPERRFLVVEVQGAPCFTRGGGRNTIRYSVWPEQIRLEKKKQQRK